MKLIKGLIMTVGVIGILVALALVTGYYLYSLTPWMQAKMIPVVGSPDAAQSFDQKLDSLEAQIKAAVAAGEKKQLILTVTEKEINSKLTQVLAEGELPLRRETLINFGDGYFLIYTIVDTPGVNAKTGAIGRIEVIGGKPKIVIDEFNLGKLPLPKTVNLRVEQLLNLVVSLELADEPVEITEVQIKNRQLAVTLTTKVAK